MEATKSVPQGTRDADGSCHYDYPEVAVPRGETAVEVRDLGIDHGRCRKISWSYNGSCALTGSTSGEWSWAYGTGWSIVSNSGSESETCSYYRGTTASTFKNTSFCWPLPTVYTYCYYVRPYGQENGTITGTRSTDSVDECAPFWMHYQVRKVT